MIFHVEAEENLKFSASKNGHLQKRNVIVEAKNETDASILVVKHYMGLGTCDDVRIIKVQPASEKQINNEFMTRI